MTTRLDMPQGLAAEMHSWQWERENKAMTDIKPTFPDLITPIPESKINGGIYKTTSAIGASVLEDRIDGGKYAVDNPMEGFTVYGTLKHKSLLVAVPLEVVRDFKHRVANWLKDYIEKNWGPAIIDTKEKLVADFLQKGGFTAGYTNNGISLYGQDNSQLNLSTGTGELPYDSIPVFARVAAPHVAVDKNTFYNGLVYDSGVLAGISRISLELALKMKERLIANGRRENGSPFHNTRDLIIVCNPLLEDAWRVINKSTVNPDNATDADNPMAGSLKKILPNPWIDTADFSAMIASGKGIEAYFGKSMITFFEEHNPDTVYGKVNFDYIITEQNFRPAVAVNAPTSA